MYAITCTGLGHTQNMSMFLTPWRWVKAQCFEAPNCAPSQQGRSGAGHRQLSGGCQLRNCTFLRLESIVSPKAYYSEYFLLGGNWAKNGAVIFGWGTGFDHCVDQVGQRAPHVFFVSSCEIPFYCVPVSPNSDLEYQPCFGGPHAVTRTRLCDELLMLAHSALDTLRLVLYLFI